MIGSDPLIRFKRFLALMVIGTVCFVSTASGQLKVDRIFPPVAVVGDSTQVKAEGKFPKWPPKIICDREDVQFTAEKDSGNFLVKVAKDAAPGPTWVRFLDEKSTSNLIPFMIAPVAITSEKEPNNANDQANKLTLPAVVAAKLQKGGDIDAYQVSLQTGDRLVASVTANQILGSPMDAVVQLADLKGNVLLQSEDVRGLDPQLVYVAKENADFLIRIFAFPQTPNSTIGFAGSSAFSYTIDITTGPFIDHAVVDSANKIFAFGWNLPDDIQAKFGKKSTLTESSRIVYHGKSLGWAWADDLDFNNDRIHGTGAKIESLPVIARGHISNSKEKHEFRFNAKKGTKYRADVRSKVNGYLLDSKLRIVDQSTGKELASNDDVSRGGYDAGVDFTAKTDGGILVELTDMVDGFGPRHVYRLHIREQKPSATLRVVADNYSLTAGKSVEVPITVARERGFSGKIQIVAKGLPKGVKAEPVTSESKGASAKSVKLKLTAEKSVSFQGKIQIVGTVLDKDAKPTLQEISVAYALTPSILISDLFVTVSP